MNGWRCSARVDDGKMQFSRGKLWDYVEQAQTAIEMALAEAEISQDEWTVSLDNMVQLALFVYFVDSLNFRSAVPSLRRAATESCRSAAMFPNFTNTTTAQKIWAFRSAELPLN